jgi:malto-oligosyltrehalose trehalohydrolase
MTPAHFGARLQDNGAVHFRFWAPAQRTVMLQIEDKPHRLAMRRAADGWHELLTNAATANTRYRYVLESGQAVPDPASHYQPDDVHGPSQIIDHHYPWTDTAWRGRPWHEAVIYELHVGAFTDEGSFAAAAGRLALLAEMGITAIELMPVADFPGRRNWGYDGVLPYAPDSSYGDCGELRALIDRAHALGLMVLLDVVYNHFGPDGNYLGLYAPQFFTDRQTTPWGPAVDFEGTASRTVREFFLQNALHWVHEYHIDGLRLDAVHAIFDRGSPHFIDELAARIRSRCGERSVHLILEDEDNRSRWLVRDQEQRIDRITAVWNDDVHHGLHAAATGERHGYYREYAGDTARLSRALAEGFAFQGEHMAYRGSARGEPSAHLPPAAFISFIQNHDQVGNRAMGERIGALASIEAVRALAAVYLLAPQIPMLFMGEEWAAPEPFFYFCDFEGELATAVREGRRREFARFPQFQDPTLRERIPDPNALATYRASHLDWGVRERSPHREMLAWYTQLLKLRHGRVIPLLAQLHGNSGRLRVVGPGALEISWLATGGQLHLRANLSATTIDGFSPEEGERLLALGDIGTRASPWAVRWNLTQP